MDSSIPLHNGEIRAVILDYGEVLSYAPEPSAIAGMAQLLGVPQARFRQLYDEHRYKYDAGQYTGEQYWAAVADSAGVAVTPEQIEHLRQADVAMWSRLNPGMLRWANELRSSGLRTAVLSNMHIDMVHFARSQFEWLTSFDCMVLSAELHMAKPDAEIFRHCLDCLQVKPGQALFIDDRERNVKAAESVGIRAICANSPESIRAQLEEMRWTAPMPG